jgi:hypothetical protein
MMSAARTAIAFRTLALCAVTLAALAACGGTEEIAPPPPDLVPATITTSLTDTLRGPVGTAISTPLTVTVRNQLGQPLDTVLVTFAVLTGGGTLSTATVRTNANGTASTNWSLGSAPGLQTVAATAAALPAVTFRAVASVGAAATIAKFAGDVQTAQINTNVAIPPAVRLTDSFNNPVAGVSVSFVATTGGGTVIGTPVTTNANGVAAVTSWRLGPNVGANVLTATAGTLTTTFSATGSVGAPAALTLTPSTIGELAIGQTQQLTARVTDAAGNVIASPNVIFTTSNGGVASVSTAGLVTATGSGTATITATAGTATATVNVTVIGHPAGVTVTNRIDLGAVAPGDIAFTQDRMYIGINGQQQILVYDGTGTTRTGTITITSGIPILLAPPRATGPVVAINVGTTSRLWFVNTATNTVYDSVDVAEVITSANMTSNGARVTAMLSNGELAIVDVASRTQTRLTLGGGITRTRIAPGDSLLYALTNVGVIFEVDIRTNTVKRQIIANPSNNDFVIARDGLFYLLDSPGNVVRLYDLNTQSVVRVVGVSPNATSISVSPDGQQIWLTHSNPAQVTVYTGNRTSGFVASGGFTTNNTQPIRVFFSPSGSFAAVGNFGGFVDIVR